MLNNNEFQFYSPHILNKHGLEPLPEINFIVNTDILRQIEARGLEIGLNKEVNPFLLEKLRTYSLHKGLPDNELIPVILRIAEDYLMGESLEVVLKRLRKVEEKISLPYLGFLEKTERQFRVWQKFLDNIRFLINFFDESTESNQLCFLSLFFEYANSRTTSEARFSREESPIDIGRRTVARVTYSRPSSVIPDSPSIRSTVEIGIILGLNKTIFYPPIFSEIEKYIEDAYAFFTLTEENERAVQEFFLYQPTEGGDKLHDFLDSAAFIFMKSCNVLGYRKPKTSFEKWQVLAHYLQPDVEFVDINDFMKIDKAIMYNALYQLIQNYKAK